MIYSATESEKVINEGNIRALYRRLWAMVEDVVPVAELCPCGTQCQGIVKSNVARLNVEAATQLENLLRQNHEYNTTQFIGSLFAQSLSELRLTVRVYAHIARTPSALPMILARLIDTYRDATPPTSVITMITHLSLKWASNGPSIGDIDDAPDVSVAELNQLSQAMTFNFNEAFIEWGHVLVRPSVDDVFSRDWLLNLFHIPEIVSGVTPAYLPESAYVNLLLRLDFARFSRLVDYNGLNLHDKLLFPLQKGLELAIALKYTRLTLLVAKILALVSFHFPSEIDKCLGILFKSVWPAQLMASTCMSMFNWADVSAPAFSLLFLDVYQLTGSITEFYKQTETIKYPARYQFVHTLFNYQYIISEIYTLDPAVAATSSNLKFPQLLVLRRLATTTTSERAALLSDGGTAFHLSRLVLDEFFYFAFIFKPAPNTLAPELFAAFRAELYTHIFVLMQTNAHLVNRFMYNVAHSLLAIEVDSISAFIEPRANSPLHFWDMTGDGLSWLGYVLSQRLLPIVDDVEFCLQHQTIVQQFVVDPPSYELAVTHAQLGSNIVFKVLLNANWEKATPLAKIKTMLILIGARRYLGTAWIPFFVNHSRISLSTDSHRTFVACILAVHPRAAHFPNDSDMFLFLQTMMQINLTFNESSNNNARLHLFDEENLTVLNYLASGSYIAGTSMDMIKPLEISFSLNTSLIPKIVVKRPWIAYMLAMASHTRDAHSKQKVKDSMMLFKDLAIELKVDPMAMLFWEQFWIFYFELAINMQSDPLNQDAKNDIQSIITGYISKGAMPPPVKLTFETFTTWTKSAILFLVSQNKDLWAVYTSRALWTFARKEEKILYENNQKGWLTNMSKEIDPTQIINQLLIPRLAIEQFASEERKYMDFEDYFKNAANSISSAREFESIKLFNDLKQYLGHTKSYFFAKCTNYNCHGNNVLVDSKKSSPNTLTSEQIQENRKKFNQHFYTLFERVYQLTTVVCVLEDPRIIKLFEHPRKLFIQIIDIASTYNDATTSTVTNTLFDMSYRLAKDILEHEPSDQEFLLDVYLPDRKDPSVENSGNAGKDFTIFVKLFKPTQIPDIATYLRFFERVIGNKELSTAQLRQTLDLFRFEAKIQQIIHLPNGKEKMYNLIPQLLQLNQLDTAIVIINTLLFLDSTNLINVTLLLMRHPASMDIIERVFGRGRPFYEFLKAIQPVQKNAVIQTIVQHVSEVKSPSTLFLLTHIIFYDFLDSQFVHSLLAKIRLIYIQALRPLETDNKPAVILGIAEFTRSLAFLTDITMLVPRAINMIWEVFYYGYMPLLDASGDYRVNRTNAIVQQIGNLAVDGHLSLATFHVSSADTLSQMCNVICQTEYGEVVVALFSILDWTQLFNMTVIPDSIALQYLKLCMHKSILHGTSINAPELGLALDSDSTQRLDWFKCSDLNEGTVVFDGAEFTNIIKSPSLKRDPTAQIQECLGYLKSLALYLDNYTLGTILALEVRSILYFVAENKQKTQSWYYPYHEQYDLVQSQLLPMIRSFAGNRDAKDTEQAGTQQKMKTLLKITLSCLEYDANDLPVTCPLDFVTDKTLASNGIKELNDKVSQVIYNFCSNLSLNLCLQIMSITHLESMLELAKKPSYLAYNEFFAHIDDFSSAVVEVDDFSQILVETLVPFATYLNNLFKYEP
eukprot:gene5719-6614_t